VANRQVLIRKKFAKWEFLILIFHLGSGKATMGDLNAKEDKQKPDSNEHPDNSKKQQSEASVEGTNSKKGNFTRSCTVLLFDLHELFAASCIQVDVNSRIFQRFQEMGALLFLIKQEVMRVHSQRYT
jgi:hypothetical protein